MIESVYESVTKKRCQHGNAMTYMGNGEYRIQPCARRAMGHSRYCWQHDIMWQRVALRKARASSRAGND